MTETSTADEFAEEVAISVRSALETLAMYVGERLGWYDALAAADSLTPSALAAATGTDTRYAREWLQQQASAGVVVPVSESADPDEQAFALPAGAAEVLTDRSSLAYLGALPRFAAAVGAQLPALLDAYRSGAGVGWSTLGADAREAQAAVNRPWFESRLGEALAGAPAIHDVLGRPDAVIIDVGCGAGYSTVALGRAYPDAMVTGIDIDAPSLDLGETDPGRAPLADRVGFEAADAEIALAERAGTVDVVAFFECFHDFARPVPMLQAARRSLRPDGRVLIMDEAVADTFAAPGDLAERLMYGYSTLICLPDGRSTVPSAATGTVMRLPVLQQYAAAAGFTVEVLPIEDFSFFRFYLLVPV